MANILTCPIPSNINPLSPNGFQFSIVRLPDLSYFCQEVAIPSITLGAPEMLTPFSSQGIPGEMLTFDQLNIQFIVDEQMSNYKGIWNWMIGLGFPESYQQYINFQNSNNTLQLSESAKNYSGGFLQVLGSNNSAVQTIEFIDLFPIALNTITFQSTSQDVQYVIGQATFKYDYYKFV
jgi:hypothetical protein